MLTSDSRTYNLDGTEGAGRIISFTNINGATIEKTLDRPDLYKDNGDGVIDDLAEAEMIFGGAGKQWRENLLNLFRTLKTSRQIPTLTRPGWQRDRAGDVVGFMCPTGQYIDAGRDGPTMRLHSNATVKDRETGGTFEGWQKAASAAERFYAGNFHWTFGLAAGFVGPILGLIGGESCGCNLSGDSSMGKTIAQKLASSVWASPAPKAGVFFPLNMTTNAIEDLASIGSESVLALDDIGNMARPADLPPLLFGMSSGAGKSRKAGREAGLSAGAEYLVFGILSNEHSLRVAIEKALGPGAYKTGLSARFPDIDVTGCKRRDDSVIAALESVKSHFGHAGPEFIRYLIENEWIDRKEELGSNIAAAVDKIAGEDAAPAQRRAAKIFALVQIAGELACDAGLMDRKRAVRLSVKIAFDRFKNSDEGRATEGAVSMLDGLRSYLTRAMGREIIPADAVEDAHYSDVKGWYTPDLFILDAGAVSDVSKLGLSGKLSGLLAALNAIGALEKSGRNNSHKVLPQDVTPTGGDNRERMVKNYRIKRDVLEV